jgi:hypothetical protein
MSATASSTVAARVVGRAGTGRASTHGSGS